jgi:hypothetical protein
MSFGIVVCGVLLDVGNWILVMSTIVGIIPYCELL